MLTNNKIIVNISSMQLFKECTKHFFDVVNEVGGKDYGFHTTRKFPGYINAGLLGKVQHD